VVFHPKPSRPDISPEYQGYRREQHPNSENFSRVDRREVKLSQPRIHEKNGKDDTWDKRETARTNRLDMASPPHFRCELSVRQHSTRFSPILHDLVALSIALLDH